MNEKEELLGKLYTLRAGMSYLCLQKKAVEGEEQRLLQKQKEIAATDARQKAEENRIYNEARQIRGLIREPEFQHSPPYFDYLFAIVGLILAVVYFVEFWNIIRPMYDIGDAVGGLILTILVACLIGGVFVALFLPIGNVIYRAKIAPVKTNVHFILTRVFDGVAVGAIFGLLMMAAGEFSYPEYVPYVDTCGAFQIKVLLTGLGLLAVYIVAPFFIYAWLDKYDRARYDVKMKKWKKETEAVLLERARQIEQGLVPIEKKYAQQRAQIEEKYMPAQTKIVTTKAGARSFLESLEASFSSLLAKEDWENLDLLIYYVETNRAETIKEALQLLDRQKQMEIIVGEIRMASTAVCQTIERGFAALGNTIASCFSRLSEQLAQQHSEKMAQLAALETSMDRVHASISDLSTALSACSDTTSEQLARDVAYIRRGF